MLLHCKMILIKTKIFRAQKGRELGNILKKKQKQKGTGFAFLTLERYFKYLHSVKGKVQA